MPQLRPEAIALIASIATILVQLLKGLMDETAKKWIPLILIVGLTAAGLGLAFAYGYDPIAGALEGLFGAAASVGFYEGLSAFPGTDRVFSSKGWIGGDY